MKSFPPSNSDSTALESPKQPVKRLNFWSLIQKGLGGTIGGPIFVIIGIVIFRARSGTLIALLINSIVMLSFVMNFSELALSLPIAGGGYSFSKEAIGGINGFLIGWLIWIGNLLFAALSGLGFALSLLTFLPNRYLPSWSVHLIGLLIILLFFIFNLRTPQFLNNLMRVLTFILVGGFVIYIVLGFVVGRKINPDFSGEILQEQIQFSEILTMTAYTFMIYCVYEWNSTFESLTSGFDQIKRPRKNIPRAFIASLLIAIVIYWLTSFVTLLNLGNSASDAWNLVTQSDAPLADTFGLILNHPIGVIFMGFIGMVATMTSINAGLQMATHVLHSMARDGFMPRQIEKTRHGVQWIALVISSLLVFGMTLFLNVDVITEISNFIFLVSMFILSLSLIILRKSRPNLIRPWKVPLYPLTPIFSIISSLILIGSMIFSTISPTSLWGVVVGIILVVFGLLFYLFQIARRDRLRLLIAGAKFGINLLVILVVFGLHLQLHVNETEIPVMRWMLGLFASIGILSLFFDIFPVRRIIAKLSEKDHPVMVVSGLFQLTDSQESVSRRINRIFGYFMLSVALLSLVLGILLLTDVFTIRSTIALVLFPEDNTFLDEMLFTLLLFQGILFLINGLIFFYQEFERTQMHAPEEA